MLSETITIAASFGSDIQRDVAMKVLRNMLSAWQTDVEGRHQNNRISMACEAQTNAPQCEGSERPSETRPHAFDPIPVGSR